MLRALWVQQRVFGAVLNEYGVFEERKEVEDSSGRDGEDGKKRR